MFGCGNGGGKKKEKRGKRNEKRDGLSPTQLNVQQGR